jgi:transcriptional regulator with XRE-family HTH domain
MEVDVKVLKELREDRAYSVRELAQKAGISHTTLWKLETEPGRNVHPRTVRRLSEALGVTPRVLTGKDQ